MMTALSGPEDSGMNPNRTRAINLIVRSQLLYPRRRPRPQMSKQL